MATLLGPHLLDDLTGHFEYEENGVTTTRTEQSQLLDWQPPVCLVLINVHQDLPNRQGLLLKPGSGETELNRLIALVGMNTASLQTHIDIRATTPIKFIADHSQLQDTKVIGRLFLDDARVKAQIMADPEKAAQFHHNLVLAARTKLNIIQADLAKRVDYWVVVNEVLGTTDDELKKLGRYEMKRMELVKPAGQGNLIYGCGLFAFANATPPTKTLWEQELKEGEGEDEVNYGIQAVLEKANADNGEHSAGPHHVLLLHQYFQPDNEEFPNYPNHTRPPGVDADGYLLAANLQNNVRRFEHNYLEDFQSNYDKLKVIISEYGLDGRIGLPNPLLIQNPSRGWKYFNRWSGSTDSQSGNGQGYLNALKALDRANRGYGVDSDVILGYCIYGWGYNNADQFWSYPLDKTPERPAPNPQDPDLEPETKRKEREKENVKRGAKVIGDLVTHAESLRGQTLPPQLRLHHDVLEGDGLNMREGPATDYAWIRTIPTGDSSWHDIVGRTPDHIRPKWWQIRVYDVGPAERSTTGWVHGGFVRFASENTLSSVPVVNVPPSSGSNPRVESISNVVALVRKVPKDDARFVQPLQGSAEASGVFELSPRWYQVQLGNRRRGWVRASQVTAHNTNSLLTRVPRLRRWPGGREAVPVRRGPGATDATVATIAADNTAWRALLARDAAYAGWWRIRATRSWAGYTRIMCRPTAASAAWP